MKAKAFVSAPELTFEIALRIRHPSIDPAELTAALGIEPTQCFRKGDIRDARSSGKSGSTYTESYWFGAINPAIWPLEFHIPEFSEFAQRNASLWNPGMALSVTARRLARNHAALLDRVRTEGGQVSVVIALSPPSIDSLSIAAEVSKALSDAGITLELELLDS